MIDRGANDAGQLTITFIVDDPRPVSVVGDFNGWDPYAHPMALGGDGLRRATVALPPGTDVRFRYLADGGAWYDDADADDHDAHGGILRTPAPETPAQPPAAAEDIPRPRTRSARPKTARPAPAQPSAT